MSIMTSVSLGFETTKKNWFKISVFGIVFSLIIALVIVPFAFLMALVAVIEGNDINILIASNGTIFWDRILLFFSALGLLLVVGAIMISIQIGMSQHIALNGTTIEEAIKYPFLNKRLASFILLGILWGIVILIIGLITSYLRFLLGINADTDLLDLKNISLSILTIIISLILLPPWIIASLAIAQDESRYNAFIFGWKKYLSKFIDLFMTNIIALIPILIAGITTGSMWVLWAGTQPETIRTSTTTVTDPGTLAIIFLLSFVTLIIGILLLFVFIPFYASTMARSYEES